MKISKKRKIYLISPNKIKNKFYKDLEDVLSLNKVEFFQLRLKNISRKKIIYIGKKILKICKKYRVNFIINDDPIIAKSINSDGCHLGQSDKNILAARKIILNKIIGITCHNSKKLVKQAIKNNADYIALGAFYKSETKKTNNKANLKLITEVKKMTNIPIVVIGGINLKNYKNLLLHNANFLAISSYIWKNKNFTPKQAMELLKI